MAALNFPATPSDGDTYAPVGSSIVYTYSTAKGSWKGNVVSSAATNTLTSTLVATNSTDSTHYPVFVDSATGNEEMRTDTGLTYNPSTGLLTAAGFSGGGGAITALNNATANELVTVGSTTTELDAEANLTFDGSNNLSIISTDSGSNANPHINLYRRSASPADLDYLGGITAYGYDSNANADVTYGSINFNATSVTNGSHEGQVLTFLAVSGTNTWNHSWTTTKLQLSELLIEWYEHKGTSYDCTLDWATPTADRTVTFPDAAGTVTLTGKQTMWIPAAAMYPREDSGCAALAKVDLGTNVPDLNILDFDPSSDEFAEFSVAPPKAWNDGTVTFQAYFTVAGTNTGTVKWELEGVGYGDNDQLTGTTYGSPIGPAAKAHSGTADDLNITAESGAVTISQGSADESDGLVYFRIGRDVSDSNDDMAGDCRLHGIKLFFTTDAANDA